MKNLFLWYAWSALLLQMSIYYFVLKGNEQRRWVILFCTFAFLLSFTLIFADLTLVKF